MNMRNPLFWATPPAITLSPVATKATVFESEPVVVTVPVPVFVFIPESENPEFEFRMAFDPFIVPTESFHENIPTIMSAAARPVAVAVKVPPEIPVEGVPEPMPPPPSKKDMMVNAPSVEAL